MALVFNNELEDGFEYTPISQREEKAPFKVTLRTLDSVTLTKLQDGLLLRDASAGVSIRSGSYNVSVLENSIVNWDGMNDVKGKPIKITLGSGGTITQASLNKIPAPLFEELAGVVVSVSQDPSTLQVFVDSE